MRAWAVRASCEKVKWTKNKGGKLRGLPEFTSQNGARWAGALSYVKILHEFLEDGGAGGLKIFLDYPLPDVKECKYKKIQPGG